MDEGAGADPKHRPTARHMVELDHAVGQHERVVVGERYDAGAEPDVPGALRRWGYEHFRAGDQLKATRGVLADPPLVIIQPIEMLEQFKVALDRQSRVLVVIVKRREKNAAAQIEIVHAESSGGKPAAADRPPSIHFPQANFPLVG